MSDLIWTIPQDLSGCRKQTPRPESIQVVGNPDLARGPDWMVRYEVKFGDQVPGMSDSRCLMTGPGILWSDRGAEQWWRWWTWQPLDWIGAFPKWDQLESWPEVKQGGGSGVEWHHEPFGGGVESGSAPIYTGATDKELYLLLVDQKTSEARERFVVDSVLRRGHCYEWLMHVRWDWDPALGFLELWLDGELVIPKFTTYTMYPDTRIYPVWGIYRNGRIGDPSLNWPVNAKPGVDYPIPFLPKKNQPVYQDGQGTPGWQLIGGLAVGTTEESVMSAYPTRNGGDVPSPTPPTPEPTPPPAPQNDPYKAEVWRLQLVNQRPQLESLITQISAAQAQLEGIKKDTQKILDDTISILNKGH